MSDQARAPQASTRARPLVMLWELIRVRLLETVREPETVFWVFVFPVLLAFALGIAFRNRPPDQGRVAVVAGHPAAESLAQNLRQRPDLDIRLESAADAARSLRIGRIDVVVRLSPEHPNALPATPGVVYEYDPTRPESRTARLLADQAIQQLYGRRDAAQIEEHKVTEPGGRYIDFLIPGLIGMNLMGSGMWGVGYAIVNARNRKLLKRFVATPMRRSHFLWSFVVSRLVFLVPEIAVLVVFGWLAFGVGLQGSLLGFALVSVVGALTFSGLGLLVGARTDSFEVASGWMNFVMMPMWLVSGSFFSYERFPAFTHPLIKALPLTAVNDGLRALMTDGASLVTVGPQLAVLLAWCVITFGLALRFFKWR